jgi:hypothetical protein
MRKLVVLSFITLDGIMQAPKIPRADSDTAGQPVTLMAFLASNGRADEPTI